MKKVVFAIVIIAAVGVLGWYIHFPLTRPTLDQIKSLPSDLFNVTENYLPGPLRTKIESQRAFLTRGGVLTFTNVERGKAGLTPLQENILLNAAAQKKLSDMFQGQYFEHESPTGKGPSDLAKEVGYAYVIVGENLALGNFKDDSALVEGWMNSPGHRANILNTRFQEIGIAVGQGMFEGKKTWLAVQSFGTPLSACPQVDSGLQQEIELHRSEIKELERDLAERKQRLESSRYNSPEAYNKEVEQYNAVVARYNNLIDTTKDLVSRYNAQVAALNACIEEE